MDNLEPIYWTVSTIILIATAFVIYYGPIAAVKVGRQLNDQQNKDAAKRQLFLNLFSYRGSPVHINFVNGLNQIDVVFNDNPEVISAWHKYYDALHLKDLVDKDRIWELLRVELLSQMATSVGYPKLSQVDITKHYFPQGHEFQNQTDWEHRQAAHEYFKGGAELYKLMIDNYKPSKGSEEPTTEDKQG